VQVREIQVKGSDVTHAVILTTWLGHAQLQIIVDGGELVRGKDGGFTAAAPLDPGSNGGLHRASDHSNEYDRVASR